MAGKDVEFAALRDGKEGGEEVKEGKEEKKEQELSLDGQMLYHAIKGDVEAMRKCKQEGAKLNVPDPGTPEKKEKDKEPDPEKIPNFPITGDYPLHGAAGGGHVGAVKEIITWEADLESKSRIGSTALHRAVSHGQTEIVELLLAEGASIDAKNKIGNTPLHCAAFCGYVEIAKLLLEANATAHLKTPNNIGFTPLSFAKSGGKSMAQLLLNYKPDTSKKLERKSRAGHLSPPTTIELETRPENSPKTSPKTSPKKADISTQEPLIVGAVPDTSPDPKLDQSGSSAPTEFHYIKTSRSELDDGDRE